MTTPVTIAVIGAGLIGPRHAQTVIDSPNTELVAIVDPAPAGADLASTLNIAHYPSLSALLESPHKPAAAIICTPNHTHVPLALDLLAANIHVLLEKPLSVDIVSGTRLVDAVAATKSACARLLVGHHRRFNSYVTAAKRIVDSGRLGEVTAVSGTWVAKKPREYFEGAGAWRATSSETGGGGGVVLINLIHELDVLHFLFGPIVRVFAEEVPRRRKGFAAEEGVVMTMRFESGVVGSFVGADNAVAGNFFESGTGENPMIPGPRRAEMKEDGDGVPRDFYRVFGTKGTLSVPDLKVVKYADEEAGSWTDELEVEVEDVGVVETPFKVQLEHFVRVVRGEEEPKCDAAAGLAAVRVCEAVRKSLRTGLPVVVGEIS